MELAMKLNGVVAAPSFKPWTKGIPLDMDALLATSPGKTPVSVFNIAHLNEDQRHFFVGLLFGRLLAWSRAQPGSDDLRALVFFDEVAGYVPPYPKSPPSKTPLLTLMKQARAVGLGVVLATQNPIDLDYKALSNAGLWCIGRLQTKQDRERVLKGIGQQKLDDTVRKLEPRQFLLYQAKGGDPVVFNSRYAMCYLKGPFTRVEIAQFVECPLHRPILEPASSDTASSSSGSGATSSKPTAPNDDTLPSPPPSKVDRSFLDPKVVFSARLEGAFEGRGRSPIHDRHSQLLAE